MSLARTEDDAPRGFVPMREYLRLQRRVDELEAKLADRRQEQRAMIDRDLIARIRAEAGVSPQGAQIIAILARSRHPLVTREALEREFERGEDHIGAVIHYANKNAADRRGAPRLIAGLNRGVFESGRYITPEGRAWLSQRIPELFEKGAAR